MSEIPTAEAWELMFSTLERELLSLEAVSLDPKVDPDIAADAVSQMEELRPILFNMRQSRGFVPGRVRL